MNADPRIRLRLFDIMKELNMNISQLSRISGVPRTTIMGFRNMAGFPSLMNLYKISRALGIDIDNLIEEM